MSYNGHTNWNQWNVSLWFGNDEGLYNLAKEAKHRTKNLNEATEYVLRGLQEFGLTKTPDGAPYTKTAIRNALRGL